MDSAKLDACVAGVDSLSKRFDAMVSGRKDASDPAPPDAKDSPEWIKLTKEHNRMMDLIKATGDKTGQLHKRHAELVKAIEKIEEEGEKKYRDWVKRNTGTGRKDAMVSARKEFPSFTLYEDGKEIGGG
jgi:hypothetical protein